MSLMTRIVRQLIADDWPAKVWFSAALGAAVRFLLYQLERVSPEGAEAG